MTVTAAWNDGWRRALRAPWIIIGVWLMTVLLALPLALTLRGMLAEHLGASMAAETAAAGVNFDWWNEFLAQAAGIGQTFVPAILGFAAVVNNLSSIADASELPTVIASVVTAHIVVSVFLMGGVLDRLSRDRATGSYGFFSACGVLAPCAFSAHDPSPGTRDPTPVTRHPTPVTRHLSPDTCHPIPVTRHPAFVWRLRRVLPPRRCRR